MMAATVMMTTSNKRAKKKQDARELARKLFETFFTSRERRTVLLCNWLCILPNGENALSTPIDVFEYWIRAIAIDPARVCIELHGLHINDKMTFPNEILLSSEMTIIREMQNNKALFFAPDGTFLYNDVVFTDVHRQLLCRDLTNIVMLKYTRFKCVLLPMYALHAVHRIMMSSDRPFFNAALSDMLYTLQGMGKSHALSIYANRQIKSK